MTPEVVVEYLEAVKQLHRGCFGVKEVNESATKMAKEVAAEGDADALTIGSLSQTPSYLFGKPKAHV